MATRILLVVLFRLFNDMTIVREGNGQFLIVLIKGGVGVAPDILDSWVSSYTITIFHEVHAHLHIYVYIFRQSTWQVIDWINLHTIYS